MSSERRVVITGVGAVTPMGVGAEPLIERWRAGECGIEGGKGECSDFDPLDTLTRKRARRTDRFTQMSLAASMEAVAGAGWIDDPGSGDGASELPFEPGRVGCVIGTGIGGITSLEREVEVLRVRGVKSVSPLAVPLMMGNAASAAVAMHHGLHGETYGVVSACAAGAHAIGDAVRMIQAGHADAALAGGAESALTGLAAAAFTSMGATSPTGVSRPFDARRDGFVMGEGAGVLVFEEASAAARRGATPLGEVVGYAATCDGHHLTAPEPTGSVAARAIELALADAEIAPGRLDYVNAHGTSTPLNDRSETEALKLALGEAAAEVPISSTKSVTGHLLGAAGAVEAIATVEALRRGVAPPTVGWEQRDEGLDLDYVPGEERTLGRRAAGDGSGGNGNGDGNGNGNGGAIGPDRLVAISNSFGFGGHNAVICLASMPQGGDTG